MNNQSQVGIIGEVPASFLSNTSITLKVNGARYDLQLEPRVSLLDALREYLGLSGTKKGCNQGACGACTVLVDGERINSCLALAVQYIVERSRPLRGYDHRRSVAPAASRLYRIRRFPVRLLHARSDSARPSAWLRNTHRACRAP